MRDTQSPITGRKIRVGLVGCGRISGKHFEALEAHAEVAELVAVCDTDLDARLDDTPRGHRTGMRGE